MPNVNKQKWMDNKSWANNKIKSLAFFSQSQKKWTAIFIGWYCSIF